MMQYKRTMHTYTRRALTLLISSAWLRALNNWKQLLIPCSTAIVSGCCCMPTAAAAIACAAVAKQDVATAPSLGTSSDGHAAASGRATAAAQSVDATAAACISTIICAMRYRVWRHACSCDRWPCHVTCLQLPVQQAAPSVREKHVTQPPQLPGRYTNAHEREAT